MRMCLHLKCGKHEPSAEFDDMEKFGENGKTR